MDERMIDSWFSVQYARRMDAYVGIYDAQLNLIKAPYFTTLEEDAFKEYIETYKQVVLVGDAVEKYKIAFPNLTCTYHPQLCSARYMAKLAYQAYIEKKFEDIAYFEPFYLKKPHITKARKLL